MFPSGCGRVVGRFGKSPHSAGRFTKSSNKCVSVLSVILLHHHPAIGLRPRCRAIWQIAETNRTIYQIVQQVCFHPVAAAL
ncbi:MAG: hypothetical protein V9G20_23645 [Candidatus Promineifilaceae bacterium]